MSLYICNLNIQNEFIILSQTPSGNSGTITLYFTQNSPQPEFDISLSTDCPYLSVPSGNIAVPDNISTGGEPTNLQQVLNFDLSGYADDCRGVQFCGNLTVTSYQNGCSGQTVDIPIYIWTICEQNDAQYSCNAYHASAIYIDKQDPSTWDVLFPFIPAADSNYAIDPQGCPYVTAYDSDEINPVESGGVFSITFDPSSFEECGENLLACEILFQFTKGEVQDLCETPIPVYITNSCPQYDCPIETDITQTTINKNAGNNGTFAIEIENFQDYDVEVTVETDCPYASVIESSFQVEGNDTYNTELSYDLTNFQTCGTTYCGTVTITATYEGQEQAAGREKLTCIKTIDVSISYKCTEDDGEYRTSLTDDDGNSTVIIDDVCEQITIYDNTSLLTESGHNVNDFTDYRTITITHLQSGSAYTLSSQEGADEEIPALSTGVTQFFHDITSGGIYEIVLCNVPTHNISATYQANDDVVFYDGQLYASLTTNQGQIPTLNPDDWQAITAAEIGNYSEKYCARQMVLSSCAIEDCFSNKMYEILCQLDCNYDELCKNRDLLDMVKFIFLIPALEEALEKQDWDAVILIYDKISQICNC